MVKPGDKACRCECHDKGYECVTMATMRAKLKALSCRAIPRAVLVALGARPGDRLVFTRGDDGSITLTVAAREEK